MSSGGRILIAEDEPRISSFLEKGLRANRYSTQVATSGSETIRLASSGCFDLVILDLRAPNTDPARVLREVRSARPRLPVILLSGRNDGTLLGLHAGACDYLKKPFRFDVLLARVRARLRTAAVQAREARSREAWNALLPGGRPPRRRSGINPDRR